MATVALSGIITPTNVVTATSTTTLTNKTLTAPTIASANLTTALTLTGASGTSGQVLTSGGSGVAPTWTTVSGGGGSPGGSTTQLQYNNAGAFGGISGVTTDGTRMTASTTIGVGGATPSTSGSGITFPATQSASSDANTLDDYEEGTWTPTLGGTSTYSVQSGRYRKIGALCTIDLAITVSSIGTGSSSQISGLPFTALSGSTSASGAIGYAESLATNIIALTFRIDSGGTVIANTVLTTAANSTSSGVGIFGNGARVLFSITYLTA
jgi:hypothetical protein